MVLNGAALVFITYLIVVTFAEVETCLATEVQKRFMKPTMLHHAVPPETCFAVACKFQQKATAFAPNNWTRKTERKQEVLIVIFRLFVYYFSAALRHILLDLRDVSLYVGGNDTCSTVYSGRGRLFLCKRAWRAGKQATSHCAVFG